MELVSIIGSMEIFMMALGVKIINMDMQLFISKIQENFIQDIGKMIKFIKRPQKRSKFQKIMFHLNRHFMERMLKKYLKMFYSKAKFLCIFRRINDLYIIY